MNWTPAIIVAAVSVVLLAIWAVLPPLFAGTDARRVAASLDRNPEDWSVYEIDGEAFELLHCSGLKIWIANGAYALRLEIPQENRLSPRHMWGLTLCGSPNQRFVRRAVDRWLAEHWTATTPDIEGLLRKGGSRR